MVDIRWYGAAAFRAALRSRFRRQSSSRRPQFGSGLSIRKRIDSYRRKSNESASRERNADVRRAPAYRLDDPVGSATFGIADEIFSLYPRP
jgi:hypothetical protein